MWKALESGGKTRRLTTGPEASRPSARDIGIVRLKVLVVKSNHVPRANVTILQHRSEYNPPSMTACLQKTLYRLRHSEDQRISGQTMSDRNFRNRRDSRNKRGEIGHRQIVTGIHAELAPTGE